MFNLLKTWLEKQVGVKKSGTKKLAKIRKHAKKNLILWMFKYMY